MNKTLSDVLNKIGEEFKEEIQPTARTYCLVDIGEAAEALGHPELKERYDDVKAVVPLRRVSGGLNFEVDGNGLADYVQLESGIAVPRYVAEEAGLQNSQYQPKSSMILNLE